MAAEPSAAAKVESAAAPSDGSATKTPPSVPPHPFILHEVAEPIGRGWREQYLTAGISWNRDSELDMDLACVLCTAEGHPLDIISYVKRADDAGAGRHSGDVRRGESEFRAGPGCGDDEQITLDLHRLSRGGTWPYGKPVELAFFVVTCYNGYITPASNLVFSLMEGRDGTGIERLRFDFQEEIVHLGGCVVARLEFELPKIPDGAAAPLTDFGLTTFTPIGLQFIEHIVHYSLDRLWRIARKPRDSNLLGMFRSRNKWVTPVWDPCNRPPPAPRSWIQSTEASRALPVNSTPAQMTPVDVTGESMLFIKAFGASNILAGDNIGSTSYAKPPSSDAYLVVTLVGGTKKQTAHTEVAEKTLYPMWKGEKLHILHPFAPDQVLKFEVMDKDMFTHKLLGTALIAISDIWSLDGPQILRLGGKAFKDNTGQGVLFVSVGWELGDALPAPKLSAYNF